MFDNMIVDMESNKKLSPIVTALLSIEKVNISLDFTWQSYFKVPKAIRLNVTGYFIMKKPNNHKKIPQQ